MSTTRLSVDGYGARRAGSFAGKVASESGPHPTGIITRMSLDGYGARRAGSFAGKGAVAAVEEDAGLLGGKEYPARGKRRQKDERYSYATPYEKILAARKEIIEVKDAIDHAALERKALQAKLEKALQSKAKKQAETQAKLEQEILRLDAETLRLQETLLILMSLIRQWDEEDALIVLAMSMPFTKFF